MFRCVRWCWWLGLRSCFLHTYSLREYLPTQNTRQGTQISYTFITHLKTQDCPTWQTVIHILHVHVAGRVRASYVSIPGADVGFCNGGSPLYYRAAVQMTCKLLDYSTLAGVDICIYTWIWCKSCNAQQKNKILPILHPASKNVLA